MDKKHCGFKINILDFQLIMSFYVSIVEINLKKRHGCSFSV